MLLKNAFIALFSFSILYAETLKECKSEEDKISGCVERQYYQNGNIWVETPYKNGKVEGIAKGYDKMGNLHIEMSFLNDMPQGDTRFYTTDKKLLALLKVENGEFISGKCFNDKALTNKDLAEISNTSDEEAYKYLQEICLKSDSNSTLAETLKECKNETDKMSGCAEREYYKNGNLEREAPFKNGKYDGIVKWYNENGNLMREAPYKNDKAEGIAKVYFENGKLMAEMSYLNNLFHGDTRFYTEDGKLLALVKGENGRITSGKCFNDKVLTDKEREDLRRLKSVEEAINYLKEICSK